jgi:hypothetical protein
VADAIDVASIALGYAVLAQASHVRATITQAKNAVVEDLKATKTPREVLGAMKTGAHPGDLIHVDPYKQNSSFPFLKYCETTIDKFGLSDDAHECVEQLIREAAQSAEDKGSARQPLMIRMADVTEKAMKWHWEQYTR